MEQYRPAGKNRLGLRTKFLLFYFIFITLLIVFISLVYFKNTNKTVYDLVIRDTLAILQKNNQIIDDRFSAVSEYANGFVADDSLNAYLDMYQRAETTYEVYQLDAPVSKLLNNYFLSAKGVFSANVMTRRMPYGMLQASNIIPAGTFSQSRVYRAAVRAEGKTVWIPTYNFFDEYQQANIPSANASYQKVFTAAKLIREMDNDYAIVVINFLDGVYAEVFGGQQTDYQAIHLVAAPDGKVVSHTNPHLIGTTLDLSWLGNAFEERSGYDMIDLNGREYIMCYDASRVTGWLSVLIIDRQALMKEFTQSILRNLSILIAIVLVVPLLLALLINNGIIRPLDSLSQGMKKSGHGIFDVPVPEAGFAEIRDLIFRFNRTNQHIDQLIKENYETRLLKQEAEFNAYNLQMNPHFILNSLNIINLELIRSGQEELSEMAVALGRVMEYTLRTKEVMVLFRQDWENTSSYLQVMQRRYKGKFCVQTSIQNDLMDSRVPKFFLQPVVENSILHGFAGIDYQGVIQIRAFTEKDARVFEVEDNGKGIEPQVVERIEAGEGSRIGLNNILYRIKYAYGDGFGISVRSVPFQKTVVRITLPLDENFRSVQ